MEIHPFSDYKPSRKYTKFFQNYKVPKKYAEDSNWIPSKYMDSDWWITAIAAFKQAKPSINLSTSKILQEYDLTSLINQATDGDLKELKPIGFFKNEMSLIKSDKIIIFNNGTLIGSELYNYIHFNFKDLRKSYVNRVLFSSLKKRYFKSDKCSQGVVLLGNDIIAVFSIVTNEAYIGYKDIDDFVKNTNTGALTHA